MNLDVTSNVCNMGGHSQDTMHRYWSAPRFPKDSHKTIVILHFSKKNSNKSTHWRNTIRKHLLTQNVYLTLSKEDAKSTEHTL
jgi:hypothetical protein